MRVCLRNFLSMHKSSLLYSMSTHTHTQTHFLLHFSATCRPPLFLSSFSGPWLCFCQLPSSPSFLNHARVFCFHLSGPTCFCPPPLYLYLLILPIVLFFHSVLTSFLSLSTSYHLSSFHFSLLIFSYLISPVLPLSLSLSHQSCLPSLCPSIPLPHLPPLFYLLTCSSSSSPATPSPAQTSPATFFTMSSLTCSLAPPQPSHSRLHLATSAPSSHTFPPVLSIIYPTSPSRIIYPQMLNYFLTCLISCHVTLPFTSQPSPGPIIFYQPVLLITYFMPSLLITLPIHTLNLCVCTVADR